MPKEWVNIILPREPGSHLKSHCQVAVYIIATDVTDNRSREHRLLLACADDNEIRIMTNILSSNATDRVLRGR